MEPLQPTLEHLIVPQLLRHDTNTRRLQPLIPRPQLTHINTRLHKRLHKRIIKYTITRQHRIKALQRVTPRQRWGYFIGLPVERPERDVRDGAFRAWPFMTFLGEIVVDVPLDELLYVELVGEDVAVDEVAEGEGVEGGDAAAELEDGGGWV